MSNFRLIDRDTGFLMPPSVDEWPERVNNFDTPGLVI